MVFANLQEKEKDAFFSLLDEYFQSRPEIFAALSSPGQKGSNSNNPFNSAAALASNNSLGQRALSAAPGAASAAASSFAKRNFGGGGGGATTSTDASTSQDSSQQVAGRVAAAAAAFSQHQRGPSTSSPTTGSTPNKLSNVDTSSLKSLFANRGSASMTPSFNKAAVPPPSVVRTPPQPEPEPEDEGEEGQWAEALYDYVSDAPGDLNIQENQQIWVTERNSDEWWTGEVDGKSGLFPASYVKLL